MSFPGSPRLLKGSIVLCDPLTGRAERTINLQYNPETLSRTLQIQAAGEGTGGKADALRIKGPAVETIKLDAELDITDQLEFPTDNPNAVESGLYPQLAVLETLVYPTTSQLQDNYNLAQRGELEILPMMAPLTLFIWGKQRVLPVRLTDFSITEEAFDPNLNPIRAKVSLGMRVLSVDDVGFNTAGGRYFRNYLMHKERLASKTPQATLTAAGIQRVEEYLST